MSFLPIADVPESAPGVKLAQPLRAVRSVDVSEQMGPQLGNPHYFWMTREYTLHMECGHTQVRAHCFFDNPVEPDSSQGQRLAAFPKRVRCSACAPVSQRVRARKVTPPPLFDPIYQGLAAAAVKVGISDCQTDALIDRINLHGLWIADPLARAQAHANVALFLIDHHMSDANNGAAWPPAVAIREALETWAADPSDENRRAVAKASRRAYNAQNQRPGNAPSKESGEGNWWTARRGIFAAATLTGNSRRLYTNVLDSVSWSSVHRTGVLRRALQTRAAFDALGIDLSSMPAPGAPGASALSQQARELADELLNMDLDDAARLVESDLPLLYACMDAYEGRRSRPMDAAQR